MLATVALRGTWLDQDDVDRLLNLSLPGIDEIAALLEIARYGRGRNYDLLVIDTAPTGHTLRMLAMPALLESVAVVFDRMQRKHRVLVEAIRGRWTPDDADALILALEREGRELKALLSDPSRTAMSWVTLPEPMAVAETQDGLEELRRLGVRVDTLVINRLTPRPVGSCTWCNARRSCERGAVDVLLSQAGDAVRIATVMAHGAEPRGTSSLAAIAKEMEGPPRLPKVRATATRVTAHMLHQDDGVSLPVDDGIVLTMFGGKGGVGKTTCAAAAALHAAARNPRCSVLLFSSDPAHSLGDVLGVELGDDPRHVPGAPANLSAREIDASARFEAIKRRYWTAMDALFDRIGRGSAADLSADRQAMHDLLALAPPGLDELMTIVEIGDALPIAPPAGSQLVVLDTAPSGHALRLLEMPGLVHDWVKALMSIVLKYQPVLGVGELGEVLLQMSQGLGRLRMLLSDRARTSFVVVTRPAVLPIEETSRLISRLTKLRIPVTAIVVNAIGGGACATCVKAKRAQERAMADLRPVSRRSRLARPLLAPAVVPPPRGPQRLMEWRMEWRRKSGPGA